MQFTKMQGAGNDYIYVNGFAEQVSRPALLAAKISDRHFGVGADGLIILQPSETGDFKMKMYNADGSEGAMCGNGIRCAVRYAVKYGIVKKNPAVVETASGLRRVFWKGEKLWVDMGTPFFEKGKKPDISGIPGAYASMRVSMGNPHFVIFVKDMETVKLGQDGARLEYAPEFPDRANIEFVQMLDEGHMKLRVWERGSGETLACGTGTCAAAAAAQRLQYGKSHIFVCNPGGVLEVKKEEDTLWLSGPAGFVFEGVWTGTDGGYESCQKTADVKGRCVSTESPCL